MGELNAEAPVFVPWPPVPSTILATGPCLCSCGGGDASSRHPLPPAPGLWLWPTLPWQDPVLPPMPSEAIWATDLELSLMDAAREAAELRRQEHDINAEFGAFVEWAFAALAPTATAREEMLQQQLLDINAEFGAFVEWSFAALEQSKPPEPCSLFLADHLDLRPPEEIRATRHSAQLDAIGAA